MATTRNFGRIFLCVMLVVLSLFYLLYVMLTTNLKSLDECDAGPDVEPAGLLAGSVKD